MPSRATLEAEYRAAVYRLGSGPCALNATIGHSDPTLDRALRRRGCRAHWCVVTPCNPRSRVLAPIANRGRLHQMRQIVRRRGWRAMPACNASADGQWIEPGLCLIDVPPVAAHELARRFGQCAWVLGRLGAAPQLVWTAQPRRSI